MYYSQDIDIVLAKVIFRKVANFCFKVLLMTALKIQDSYLSHIVKKKSAGCRVFSHCAPFLWNNLTDIRQSDSVEVQA